MQLSQQRLLAALAVAALIVLAVIATREYGGAPGPTGPTTATATGATGMTRVIVALKDLTVGPDQKDAIAKAQDELLKSLDPTQYKLLHRYSILPTLALEVTPAGLAALKASPLVAGVEEDKLNMPKASGG